MMLLKYHLTQGLAGIEERFFFLDWHHLCFCLRRSFVFEHHSIPQESSSWTVLGPPISPTGSCRRSYTPNSESPIVATMSNEPEIPVPPEPSTHDILKALLAKKESFNRAIKKSVPSTAPQAPPVQVFYDCDQFPGPLEGQSCPSDWSPPRKGTSSDNDE